MNERAKFDCAPGLRLHAHEQLVAVQLKHMEERFNRLEVMMERMEKRLWLTVYGVVAIILAQAVESLLVVAP